MTKYLGEKRSGAFLFLLVLFVGASAVGFLSGTLIIQPRSESGELFFLLLIAAILLLVACGVILWYIRKEGASRQQSDGDQKSANSQAEDLKNEKKYFSSILSHDLRSPLSSIVLLTSYIKTKDENPETLRYLDLIEQSARKELDMMATLLALMRADSFKTEQVEELNLGSLIDDTLQNAEVQLRKKSVQFSLDIAPDLTFRADPDNLKLVLKSLISQAICYSKAGQAIEVKAFQDSKNLTFELMVLSEELLRHDHIELFRSERLAIQDTGNAFPDCIHLYFLGKAIRNYNGTIHVQRVENNPASRFILTLEQLPTNTTA